MTGAAGCVGRAFLGRLDSIDAKAAGLDLSPPPAGVRFEKWIRGDILDEECSSGALRGIDTVVHLAAKAHSAPKTKEDVNQFWRINAEGTRTLIAAAIKNRVRRFIHVSTVAVMARPPLGTASAYADSKHAAEQEVIAQGDRIEVIVVRPATVYGPNDRGNVLKLIRWIDRGLPAMIGPGRNRKSLVYSDNLAEALLFLSEHGKRGETYVVTDGRDLSMYEIIREISLRLGKEDRIPSISPGIMNTIAGVNDWLTDRFGFPRYLGRETIEKLIGDSVFDPSLLFSLGFKPAFSFEKGMEETVRWYKRSAR